jgi:hypothetical protein
MYIFTLGTYIYQRHDESQPNIPTLHYDRSFFSVTSCQMSLAWLSRRDIFRLLPIIQFLIMSSLPLHMSIRIPNLVGQFSIDAVELFPSAIWRGSLAWTLTCFSSFVSLVLFGTHSATSRSTPCASRPNRLPSTLVPEHPFLMHMCPWKQSAFRHAPLKWQGNSFNLCPRTWSSEGLIGLWSKRHFLAWRQEPVR